jgi:hypothetical protein
MGALGAVGGVMPGSRRPGVEITPGGVRAMFAALFGVCKVWIGMIVEPGDCVTGMLGDVGPWRGGTPVREAVGEVGGVSGVVETLLGAGNRMSGEGLAFFVGSLSVLEQPTLTPRTRTTKARIMRQTLSAGRESIPQSQTSRHPWRFVGSSRCDEGL